MKIKKIDEETTFKKSTIKHKFELENGKVVRYYEYKYYSVDDYPCDDYEFSVDEEDFEKLTDEEKDLLDESEGELLKLTINEEYVAI